MVDDASKAKAFMIGIAGLPASGKHTMAKRIVASLREAHGGAAVGYVSEEDYYRDQSDVPEDAWADVKFHHPDHIDHALLARHLRELKAGRPIRSPFFNWDTYRSVPSATPVPAAPVIIVEGIFLFYSREVMELLDYRVYMEPSLTLALPPPGSILLNSAKYAKRMPLRPEVDFDTFKKLVVHMTEKFVTPHSNCADMIVPGAPTQHVPQSIIEHKATKQILARREAHL